MTSGYIDKERCLQTIKELPCRYILLILRVRLSHGQCQFSTFLLQYSVLLWLLLFLEYSKVFPSIGALCLVFSLLGISLFPGSFTFSSLNLQKLFFAHSFPSILHSQSLWSLSQLLPWQKESCLSGLLSFSNFQNIGCQYNRN